MNVALTNEDKAIFNFTSGPSVWEHRMACHKADEADARIMAIAQDSKNTTAVAGTGYAFCQVRSGRRADRHIAEGC